MVVHGRSLRRGVLSPDLCNLLSLTSVFYHKNVTFFSILRSYSEEIRPSLNPFFCVISIT